MKFVDQNFVGAEVVMDGNEYDRCVFANCKMIYSGGDFALNHPTVQGTVDVIFKDAAHRTAQFCQWISRLPGGEQLVQSLLAQSASLPVFEKLKPQ